MKKNNATAIAKKDKKVKQNLIKIAERKRKSKNLPSVEAQESLYSIQCLGNEHYTKYKELCEKLR